MIPEATEPAPAKGRVLIVDDDAETRSMLVELLRAEGYALSEAGDGFEALEKLVGETIDLVLADLNMPMMDGYELLSRMQQDQQLREIPVIIISGWSEFDNIIRGIQLGAADHLAKPFNQLLLRNRIDACIERKRLADTQQAALQAVEAARSRTDELLTGALPPAIATRLKAGEKVIADRCDQATVLVARLTGFSAHAARVTPKRAVKLFNQILAAFERLARKHGLEEIKTAGERYLAVAGMDGADPDRAASAAALMALGMVEQLKKINARAKSHLGLRIGLHTGTVIAGIVGKGRLHYDVWGDAVNTAAHLEATGATSKIQITNAVADRLGDRFKVKTRGVIPSEGKGKLTSSWLTGRDA